MSFIIALQKEFYKVLKGYQVPTMEFWCNSIDDSKLIRRNRYPAPSSFQSRCPSGQWGSRHLVVALSCVQRSSYPHPQRTNQMTILRCTVSEREKIGCRWDRDADATGLAPRRFARDRARVEVSAPRVSPHVAASTPPGRLGVGSSLFGGPRRGAGGGS